MQPLWLVLRSGFSQQVQDTGTESGPFYSLLVYNKGIATSNKGTTSSNKEVSNIPICCVRCLQEISREVFSAMTREGAAAGAGTAKNISMIGHIRQPYMCTIIGNIGCEKTLQALQQEYITWNGRTSRHQLQAIFTRWPTLKILRSRRKVAWTWRPKTCHLHLPMLYSCLLTDKWTLFPIPYCVFSDSFVNIARLADDLSVSISRAALKAPASARSVPLQGAPGCIDVEPVKTGSKRALLR